MDLARKNQPARQREGGGRTTRGSTPRSADRPGKQETLGVRPQVEWTGARGGRVRSDHPRVRKDGRMVEGAERRIGGNGKHGSVLDCAARGIGEARIGSDAGGYPAVGQGAWPEKGRPGGRTAGKSS